MKSLLIINFATALLLSPYIKTETEKFKTIELEEYSIVDSTFAHQIDYYFKEYCSCNILDESHYWLFDIYEFLGGYTFASSLLHDEEISDNAIGYFDYHGYSFILYGDSPKIISQNIRQTHI